MGTAKRHKVEVVVCWRLDRFGRSLRHLVTTIEEPNAAGVAFVSLGESIEQPPLGGSSWASRAALQSSNGSDVLGRDCRLSGSKPSPDVPSVRRLNNWEYPAQR